MLVNVEKLDDSYNPGENKMVQPHWNTIWKFLIKPNMQKNKYQINK